MATGNLAAYAVNVANQSFTYDSPTTQTMRYQTGFIGTPLVGTLSTNTGLTTGNAVASVIFRAEANCFVYSTDMTVVIAGTGGAAANVTVFLLPANNGVNVDASWTSSNIELGNVVVLGTNVVGNVANTGPYTYNVYANGAASSTNAATQGGFFVPAGSLLVANSTLNVGYVACSTQYKHAPNAQYTA